MICVIGSGLSGIAAATALVQRGFKPTILDAGVQASDDIASLKARLASVEPDHWSTEDLRRLKHMGPATESGIPRKLHFGSDFAYREADWETAARSDGAAILRSFARGGFSNVWGGMIPARAAIDCCDWPFTRSVWCHTTTPLAVFYVLRTKGSKPARRPRLCMPTWYSIRARSQAKGFNSVRLHLPCVRPMTPVAKVAGCADCVCMDVRTIPSFRQHRNWRG